MPPKPARAPRKKRSKAEKAEAQNAHLALVLEATYEVVRTLKAQRISCAVFGSLACKLYGASRCPKDVDLLTLQDRTRPNALDAEGLKKLILDKNPRHFYLKLPRDPEAEYRILWYRQSYLGAECKVDILVPGTIELPHVAEHTVIWVDNVPLVPFSLLLLHKLQGWDDHRLAEELHKQKKQHQDAADIKRLLDMQKLADKLIRTQPWQDRQLFSDTFQDLTKRRVKDYCRAFPDRAHRWSALGFDVGDPTASQDSEPPILDRGQSVAVSPEPSEDDIPDDA